jgi:hypothetical protein
MFTTLGFLPAQLVAGRHAADEGGGLFDARDRLRRQKWKAHNKPCRMKGNGFVWRADWLWC